VIPQHGTSNAQTTAPAQNKISGTPGHLSENAETTRQAARNRRPLVIAFSHAVSELLVVKSVRAYADLRAKEIGGIVLLHGTTQSGDLAHQALLSHPELSIVIGINDEFALGAAQAFAAAGKDPARSFICGQDGAPEGLREIARGLHYKGTAAIFFDQLGAAIVDMSVNAIEGKPASISIPCAYISLARPAQLEKLIRAFEAVTGPR
jgi:ABC-type sugar transport system substrate-binding protein